MATSAEVPKLFFDELSEEQQHILSSAGTAIVVQQGTVLFQEGDDPEFIYLIRSGKIKTTKMTEEGREIILQLKQPGELVGEVSLFNQIRINITAEAVERSELISYPASQLEKLFEKHGQLAIAYIKWYSREAQVSEAKFRDLLLFGKKGALYSTLIRFSNSYGKQVEDGILIKARLTNQNLADYIGTTRENVNRLLTQLREEKVVRVEKGHMTILNISFLKAYLQCGDCPIEICKI